MKTFLRSVILSALLAVSACGGGGSDVAPGGSGTVGGVVDGGGTGGTGNGSTGGTDGAGSTGGTGSASGTDGATAGAPGDGGGVGSGGTGVSTAAVGVADGFGSVIVNGVRFNTDGAEILTEDAPGLRLGMTVLVRGTIDAGLSTGTATSVLSVPELRGAVTAVQAAALQFSVAGVTVQVDDATVFDGVANLAGLSAGTAVQVYALPESDGLWRATRVEVAAAATPFIVSGTLTRLDPVARTFELAGWRVQYGNAALVGGLRSTGLSEGQRVYVRSAGAPVGGLLQAGQIREAHALSPQATTPVALLGLVSQFSTLQQFFVVAGTRIDASAALVNGGPRTAIGNGVKLDVAGTMVNGVLVATRLRIRHVPGTGGPASFDVIGTVGQFVSLASFRVNGQVINASAPSVQFVNGTASNLRNGVSVSVTGSQVVDGVLQATTVRFP